VETRVVGQLENLQAGELADGVRYGAFQPGLLQRDRHNILAVAVDDEVVEGMAAARVGAVVAALPLGAVLVQTVVERLIDGIQAEKVTTSKSEQVKQCMDLEHCLHWLHFLWSPLTWNASHASTESSEEPVQLYMPAHQSGVSPAHFVGGGGGVGGVGGVGGAGVGGVHLLAPVGKDAALAMPHMSLSRTMRMYPVSPQEVPQLRRQTRMGHRSELGRSTELE
jgi:hypothetical protein